MHTAAIIIPTPHVISKYFNASIEVLLCASALLPGFLRYRLPDHLSDKQQPEHLPENQFLRQQRHRHRKNQARHHRHKCDRHLHDALRKNCPQTRTKDLNQKPGARCTGLRALLLPIHLRRDLLRRHIRRSTKYLRNLVVPLSANLDHISHAQHCEQPLDISILQTDASMRSSPPNRSRRIRPMNSVALQVQPDPARAHRTVCIGRHHHTFVVVRWIRHSIHNFELPRWTRTHRRTHRNRKVRQHLPLLHHRQPTVDNANQHYPPCPRPLISLCIALRETRDCNR